MIKRKEYEDLIMFLSCLCFHGQFGEICLHRKLSPLFIQSESYLHKSQCYLRNDIPNYGNGPTGHIGNFDFFTYGILFLYKPGNTYVENKNVQEIDQGIRTTREIILASLRTQNQERYLVEPIVDNKWEYSYLSCCTGLSLVHRCLNVRLCYRMNRGLYSVNNIEIAFKSYVKIFNSKVCNIKHRKCIIRQYA